MLKTKKCGLAPLRMFFSCRTNKELYKSNKHNLGPYHPVSRCQDILRVVAVTAGCPSTLGLSRDGSGGQCWTAPMPSPPIPSFQAQGPL